MTASPSHKPRVSAPGVAPQQSADSIARAAWSSRGIVTVSETVGPACSCPRRGGHRNVAGCARNASPGYWRGVVAHRSTFDISTEVSMIRHLTRGGVAGCCFENRRAAQLVGARGCEPREVGSSPTRLIQSRPQPFLSFGLLTPLVVKGGSTPPFVLREAPAAGGFRVFASCGIGETVLPWGHTEPRGDDDLRRDRGPTHPHGRAA